MNVRRGGNKKSKVREGSESYGEFERSDTIDHVVYELQPSPSVNHQRIVFHLSRKIYETCHASGEAFVSPIDVVLDEGNRLQPDFVFVQHENSHIVKENGIEGVPDLVAEVLSPHTGKHDKSRKKAVCERFGVKELWLVDPFSLTLDQYVWKNGKYDWTATYGEGDTVVSDIFTCVSIDMNELFASIDRQ